MHKLLDCSTSLLCFFSYLYLFRLGIQCDCNDCCSHTFVRFVLCKPCIVCNGFIVNSQSVTCVNKLIDFSTEEVDMCSQCVITGLCCQFLTFC